MQDKIEKLENKLALGIGLFLTIGVGAILAVAILR
jgi:hypothetical protein